MTLPTTSFDRLLYGVTALMRAQKTYGWARLAPIVIPLGVLLMSLCFAVLFRVAPSFWVGFFLLPLAAAPLFGATWAYLAGALAVLGYLAIIIANGALRLNSPEELLNSSALSFFSLLAGGLVQSKQRQQAELERRVAEETRGHTVRSARREGVSANRGRWTR